jgi:hypothetical protein
MSMSKRILFGDDPADDHIREKMRKDTEEFLEPFKFKIPTRRRNRLGRGPHWDPYWRSCLTAAAEELSVEAVQINDQMCVKTQAYVAAVKSRAEELHQARINELSSATISV